jgi:hypothetical protein
MTSETGLFYSDKILKGKYVLYGNGVDDTEIRNTIKKEMTGTCVYNTNLKNLPSKKGLVIPGTKTNKEQLDKIATEEEDAKEAKSSADIMRKKKGKKEEEEDEEEDEKSEDSGEDTEEEEDRMKAIENRTAERKKDGNESDPDSDEDDIVTLCRKVKNTKIKTRKEIDVLKEQVRKLTEKLSDEKKD